MLCVDVKADDIRSYTTRSAVERKQSKLNVQSKRVYEQIVIANRSFSVGGRGCGMAAAAPYLMI